jgi:hypothetical protein
MTIIDIDLSFLWLWVDCAPWAAGWSSLDRFRLHPRPGLWAGFRAVGQSRVIPFPVACNRGVTRTNKYGTKSQLLPRLTPHRKQEAPARQAHRTDS